MRTRDLVTGFVWMAVHRTVIKFVEPLSCQPASLPDHAEPILNAMQRLVAIINTLRSSQASALEGTSKRWLSDAQTLEALLPYVSEEAYDVLEALQAAEGRRQKGGVGRREAGGGSGESAIKAQNSKLTSLLTPHPSPLTPLTTIDTLIPSLLWHLARGAYSTMQLIEGVRVKCWQSEQGWAFGMLRLVVMLEAETPTQRWCFDVATGYPAEPLLEPTAIVQSDECALPIQPIASTKASLSASACQVDHQLTAIVQSLELHQSGLKPLLQGAAIELLQPGSNWQAGTLRLQLGFAFSAQSDATGNHEGTRMPELIDAELMDDASGITHSRPSPYAATPLTRTIGGLATKTHVSVVHPVSRALSQTTLVRVTDAAKLERYTQGITQQQLMQSLDQLQHQQSSRGNESNQLRLIVQTAIAAARQLSIPGIDLSQPMLLMDELVPKLLWSLASSTYEMMQLLGGIPAQVLQPQADWRRGTLRLLAALHLKTADVDDTLDLSTGRSILMNTTRLGLDAIVQTSTAICSQPTAVAPLTDYLQQQLDHAMLEYRLLRDGVSIAWLEDVEQDWQTGSMQLSLSLAFVADAH